MKLIVDLFTMQTNGIPSVSSQENRFEKGCSFALTQPGDISDVPSIMIKRIGWFKFKLEVKSDKYREYEKKPLMVFENDKIIEKHIVVMDNGIPFDLTIPNDVTLKAIGDVENKNNLESSESLEDLFNELGRERIIMEYLIGFAAGSFFASVVIFILTRSKS